ncbi:hypothetical protein [Paenibacillus sp. A14]
MYSEARNYSMVMFRGEVVQDEIKTLGTMVTAAEYPEKAQITRVFFTL